MVNTPSLKLTRPEIYYGEVTHEPVFVNTAQEEFNYPSGEDNEHSRYEGKGGFPISSFWPCAWPPPSARASPTFC